MVTRKERRDFHVSPSTAIETEYTGFWPKVSFAAEILLVQWTTNGEMIPWISIDNFYPSVVDWFKTSAVRMGL